MAFTNNFRIERIYFEKLKSNIDILKSYIEAGATGEALELLKNSVDVDGAVLLLYRNLGEAWAELADLIQKTQKELKDLAEKTEAYHDELNERIDEVNNYIMALIRELDARLQAVEQDLATMNRNKFYDLVENNGSYLIEKDGETVYFDDIKEDVDFPHDVILRYDNGTSETELEIREFTDSRIDFYSIGLADSDKTVKEILVSIDNTEAVTYTEKTLENPLYTFGTGLSLDSNNELSVDFNSVQGKLTEGTGIDIDSNNEISVDTSVIQGKLTEGFGIDIDSNNEIKVDTAQVQEKLIAGQNITLTPDTTDPTKTVIDAQGGGSSYTAGNGIDITNNVIRFKGPYFGGSSKYIGSESNLASHFQKDTTAGHSATFIKSVATFNLNSATYNGDYSFLNLETNVKIPNKSSISGSLWDKLDQWQNKHNFTLIANAIMSTANEISNMFGGSQATSIRVEFDSDGIKFNGCLPSYTYAGSFEPFTGAFIADVSQCFVPLQNHNAYLGLGIFVLVDDVSYIDDVLAFFNSLSSSELNQIVGITARLYN